MADPIFIIDIGPDGVVATHPRRAELPDLVAPVPRQRKTKDFNTIHSQLITIGCMQLPGKGFEFDSSFISPHSAGRFTKFVTLLQALQKQDDGDPKRFPPCSVFGHADPTGPDDYNKHLAGRRARAVYALLTRDKKIWNELYNIPFGGDRWGMRSIRMMLSISLKKGEPAFYTGPIEPGESKAEKADVQKQTHDAIARYQEDRGLLQKGSGFPGDKTRDLLFTEYMGAICHDKSGTPFQLDPQRDFIAKHQDGDGLKGDVQGCGEFNEIFLLSKEQEELAMKDKVIEKVRNEIYRVNRRVVVYVFKHGTEINPKKWPCPRAIEGTFGCTLRFWSDHKDRRKRSSNQRTFGKEMDLFERDANGNLVLGTDGKPTARKVAETGNTMACRWYHAFAIHSPCERKMEEWIVRIRVDSAKKDPEPLIGRRYVIVAGEAQFSPILRGVTNDRGEIRIPVFDEKVKMKLRLDAWGKLFKPDDNSDAPAAPQPGSGSDTGFDTDKFSDEDKFLTFDLDAGALRQMSAGGNELPVKQRLYNLGFGSNAPDKWTDEEFQQAVRQYRSFKGLGKDSNLDGQTRIALEEDHELSDLGPQPDDTQDSTANSKDEQ